MSKRGRRRNSKRRKSSSSSKQSVSPYIFQKQNKSNSVSYNDIVEKGETDSFCLRKENVQSASEDEEKYSNDLPKEKRFKQDHHMNLFAHQKSVYTKTTKDEERGVKIVTSVSVSDMDDAPPNITFQQSQEPLSENHTSAPVTNILKINCSGSHVKLEIQEMLHLNSSGIKTTFVFMNENGSSGAEMLFKNQCERTCVPNNEVVTNHSRDSNYRFTFGSMSEQTEALRDLKPVNMTNMWDKPNCCQCCCDRKGFTTNRSSSSPTADMKNEGKRKSFHKRLSSDWSWDIPPPREFADTKYNTLDDLTHDLASCRISSFSPSDKQLRDFHRTFTEESSFSAPAEETNPSFDQLSESDNYEPMFMRPSLSTTRSSLTKDFINCQEGKSWIRNNSIATVEHKACSLPRKRRQTFPGMSLLQEDLLPCSDSFSSLIMSSLPFQTERTGRIQRESDRFGTGSYTTSHTKKSSKPSSEIPDSHDGKQALLSPFYVTSSEENPDEVFTVSTQSQRRHSNRRQHAGLTQNVSKEKESPDTDDYEYKVDQSEVADSGYDQDIGEVEFHGSEPLTQELSRRALAIQVIPPSRSGSEEQILQSHSAAPEHRKSSVMTVTVGELEERLRQMDSSMSSLGSCAEKQLPVSLEDPFSSPVHDLDVCSINTNDGGDETKPEVTGSSRNSLQCMTEDVNDMQLDGGRTEGSNEPAAAGSCPAKGLTDTGLHGKELQSKMGRQIVSRSLSDAKEHLKPVVHKDSDACDHWAKRRKLFKESKQWSSAGGSSITSDITEESVSEDTRSMDMKVQDNEDRGFYTETFHSSAWIYQGDEVVTAAIRPSLASRTRAVSIRERTVKISKGAGEYPWGFRIQFSKPIVVTEVDTNGAAEEAGLLVGDYVLAVNGIDVTSIPHSEAADLARQGPDILTLTIGSDIARGPNTPRPACRGYLHKRTQSGLIKGWRKRWFVLAHDCCLYYYRHKRDEGKRPALSAVKLEGAEVGADPSLGKPFVFKCRPQSGSRVFFFCATSNQEMKRWLEAMEKAIHPITQNHVWVDVTRHNSNLPPLAVKSPDCLGLLHKMDKSKDTWVQHYCILKDACLYLYSGIRATHAHGGIYLQGYMVREQPYGSKKSTIELKPPSDEFKTFYLCAENPNENKRWIVSIKASIKKWLPLHQALQDYMSRPPEETRM